MEIKPGGWNIPLSADFSEGSPERELLDGIKDHLVSILARASTERAAFLKCYFKAMGLRDLANYKLDGIFSCKTDLYADSPISVAEYIKSILYQVQSAVSGLAESQKRPLLVDGLIRLGPQYDSGKKRTAAAVQAVPGTASMGTNTGVEMLTAYMAGSQLVVRRSANQLALDKEMECEFEKTL